ncbi:MAG: dGTPase, partial [Flavobacteriaceae bacterium]|nr:dGTPase [Flavobacteriaceae bacterium]
INNTYHHTASNYDKLILLLLPDKYKDIDDDLYTRILNICNLVANFSDGNAILLHKKIKGIDLD